MPENKSHHYVAQSYLRNFSRDGKSIRVFSIRESRLVSEQAPISGQCKKDYLYGKEPGIEKVLADLERYTKPIFDKLRTGQLPAADTHEYLTLLIYIIYQSARTISAAEKLNELTDKTTKAVLKADLRNRRNPGYTANDIDRGSFSIDETPRFSIGTMARMIPGLTDLKFRLLINKTNSEFITSDNPTIFYNPYYLNHIYPHTDVASTGLLMGIPIDPRTYLLYYDPNMYAIPKDFWRPYFTISKQEDVHQLNILQAANANKTLYSLTMAADELDSINRLTTDFRPKEIISIQEDFVFDKTSGKIMKKITPIKGRISYNASISFLKRRKDASAEYLEKNWLRNPELTRLHTTFIERVKEGKYSGIEWPKFLDDIRRQK